MRPTRNKAIDIVNHQFGLVDQRQATGRSVAKKLIPQAAFNMGNDTQVAHTGSFTQIATA